MSQSGSTKAILTGMNGTVAPAVATVLRGRNVSVIPWDRSRITPGNEGAMREFLRREQPDWLLHIATGPPEWAGDLARLSQEEGIRFLFTSSVSVFAGRAPGDGRGAYLPDRDQPDATDDYGRYKAECEQRVQVANPAALIARLGWQIGDRPGTNTMLDFLQRTSQENGGHIQASTRWYPSCAFLEDTAEALFSLLTNGDRYPSGIFHLNGNPSHVFYDIAVALRDMHGESWKIQPATDFERDDRMADRRLEIRPIGERLKLISA